MRVLLRPVQRQFTDRDDKGPAKLTGGADTGKIVVLLHRTQRLAAENPGVHVDGIDALGRNDLVIAEVNHQRIDGQKLVLSHDGIASRGRSRRLTFNYRTTQQVLGWAMQVLDGAAANDADRADALLRERSLLYVAATRARHVLAISWAGWHSPLLG